MNIEQLLSALFNLGAQTDFWNSNAAARDFWTVFGAVVVLGIIALIVRGYHTPGPRLRHH